MKPRKAVERAGGEGTPVQEELLGACCLKASQLLQVLEEESVVLKTFQTDLLLAILPRKESLTLELGKIVEDLARLKAETGKVDHDPSFARFGERLKEIRKRNRWNQAFLKGSLLYVQDLLQCFIPPTYPPGRDKAAWPVSAPVKGLALRKEA